MTPLRYPVSALAGDYARAALGLALTAGPLLLLDVDRWMGIPLAVAAVLFAAYALRTAERHLSRLALDAEGLTLDGPRGRTAFAWSGLDRLDLRYYSTRRDRSGGWLQVTLGAGRRRVALDSALDGFDAVIEQAAEAARRNGLRLSRVTVDNLLALGIDMPDEDFAAGGGERRA